MIINTQEDFLQLMREQNAPEYTRKVFGKEVHYIGSGSGKYYVPFFFRPDLDRLEYYYPSDMYRGNKLCYLIQNQTSYRFNLDNHKLYAYTGWSWEETNFPLLNRYPAATTYEDLEPCIKEFVKKNKNRYSKYIDNCINGIKNQIAGHKESIKNIEQRIEELNQEIVKYEKLKEEL